jgi:hypothetical protein
VLTLYQPGRPRRTQALRVLRTRVLYWLLFVVPAAAAPLVWRQGYPGSAGVAAVIAFIGLVWFVRVWRETER